MASTALSGVAAGAPAERKEKVKDDAAALEEEQSNGLDALYDDGFGGVTVKDYFAAAKAVSRDDGGPPRWFCPVECGRPAVDGAPLLLFLPGTDGVGMGLILHHKSLGKVFEVRCLHIPVNDRTPFEGMMLLDKTWFIQSASLFYSCVAIIFFNNGNEFQPSVYGQKIITKQNHPWSNWEKK